MLKYFGLIAVPLVLMFIVLTNDVRPTAMSANFAYGQTGPTGPTGPTGATGAGGTTYNNHTLFSGSAPTITVCGTTPSVATGGTDNSSTINVGAATLDIYRHPIAVTNCTITFATAFTNPPVVNLTSNQAGLGATVLRKTTTLMVVRFSIAAQGLQFSYTAF